VRTMFQAVSLAQTRNAANIYVAAGNYTTPSFTTASIFGGYSATSWDVRDPAVHTTTFTNSSTNGVETSSTRRIVLDGLNMIGAVPIIAVGDTVITRLTLQASQYGIASNASGIQLTVAATTIVATSSFVTGIAVGSRERVTVVDTTITGSPSNTGLTGISIGREGRLQVVGVTVSATNPGDSLRVGVQIGERTFASIERSTLTLTSGRDCYGVRAQDLDVTITLRDSVVTTGCTTESYGLDVSPGVTTVVGNTFLDARGGTYYGIHARGTDAFRNARIEIANNVIHADNAAWAVGIRLFGTVTASAINNVVWLQTHGSAVELTATDSGVSLYHNDLVAVPGRCLLETPANGGTCAVDIDDVNACGPDLQCDGSGGNLTAVPGFVSPGTGDYHLSASSPLIDRGYNPVAGDGLAALERTTGPLGAISLFAAGLAALDRDRNARSAVLRWDIGVDEVP
jgi:hypothetical protein